MKLINGIKNDIAGAAILADWLGSGGVPVHHTRADARADVCNQCSENTGGKWWDNTKHIIADAIKNQLEVKNHMQLHCKGEDSLFMCRVCGCCNQLAVQTPIVHIAHHTSSQMLKKYPSWCWKRKEIESNFLEK